MVRVTVAGKARSPVVLKWTTPINTCILLIRLNRVDTAQWQFVDDIDCLTVIGLAWRSDLSKLLDAYSHFGAMTSSW